MEYQKICNGIVIIKKFLSIEQQNELIEKIIDPMINKKIFWKENGELNFMNLRGRHYCNLDDYQDSKLLKKICDDLMKNVQQIDTSMPYCKPTHLLTLYYRSNHGIGWHRDNGNNDGDLDAPIISFTIGNSCIFEYKLEQTKHSVQLNSGDVIIFGGEQRLLYHRVKKVILKTKPNELCLKDNARINFTFRQAISVTGNEDYYSTDNYVGRILSKNLINNQK